MNGWWAAAVACSAWCPRDPNASVAVNRIQWNEKTGGYDHVEVLYRSESGEPILVFACADMGSLSIPTPR